MEHKTSYNYWEVEITHKILTKEEVISQGVEIDGHIDLGGEDFQQHVICDEQGNETIFSGLAYDLFGDSNTDLYIYFFVENGIQHGPLVTFYENGNLEYVGNFYRGAAEGLQVEYFEDGKIKSKTVAKVGRIMTYVEYNETSQVIEEKKAPTEMDLKWAKKFENMQLD